MLVLPSRALRTYSGSTSFSSLSELEDVSDNNINKDDDEQLVEHVPEEKGDYDTEAETERLEASPEKSRRSDGIVVAVRKHTSLDSSELNNYGTTNRRTQTESSVVNRLSRASRSGDSGNTVHASTTGKLTLLSGRKGVKRKRAAALSPSSQDSNPSKPHRKRSSSDVRGSLVPLPKSVEETHAGLGPFDSKHGHGTGKRQENHESFDISAALLENTEDVPQSCLMTTTMVDHGMADEDNEISDTESLQSRDDPGRNIDGDDEAPGEADEPADADLDGEDEETEPVIKSEDELIKKKSAVDALGPIETLFAILRDKLFEERHSMLTAELELLNQANTSHAEYLAMRQCIDERRDEKIRLERVTMEYKMKCLESKMIAERAQLHSQFFQTVRELREHSLATLNEQYCRIQKERRQWKVREPQFVSHFEPRRSRQIMLQRAYNKEVSILSGIARYVGFPAAPEIQGAGFEEAENDFRDMQIKPRASSYVAQIAHSTRADDAAAEEQFLERTPWANPKHPAHQQAMVLEGLSAAASLPYRRTARTPLTQKWFVDIDRPPGGSLATAAPESDPPSSNVAASRTRHSPEPKPTPDGLPLHQTQQNGNGYSLNQTYHGYHDGTMATAKTGQTMSNRLVSSSRESFNGSHSHKPKTEDERMDPYVYPGLPIAGFDVRPSMGDLQERLSIANFGRV